SREIEFHRLPLSRAGIPNASRTGLELFQQLLQLAARAHAATVFGSGEPEAFRPSAVDDDRQAGVVHRVQLVRHKALPGADSDDGEKAASCGRALVPGGMLRERG